MGRTMIRGVRLFDGVSVYEDATVVFESESGRILSVSHDSAQQQHSSSEEDTEAIDGKGYTLIPGLIDAHVHIHLLHVPPGTVANPTDILVPALKCGVTTLCDMHSDPPTVQHMRASVRAEVQTARLEQKHSTVKWPDLKTAFYAATIENGWPKPILLHGEPSEDTQQEIKRWPNVTIETARDFVQSNKQLGADYIKLMQENCRSLGLPTDSVPSASLALQTSVVNAAHDEGLLTVGHALDIKNTSILLEAGVDGLTHTFVDQIPTDDLVTLYKQKGSFLIPTLTVLSSLLGEAQELRKKLAEIALVKEIINQPTHDNMVEQLKLHKPDVSIEYAYESVRRLHREGIDIVAGTDAVTGLKGTAIGPSMWMELQLYVSKCGFSPLEALRAATSVSAKRFHFADRGTISEGQRADLVLVKGDVTKDVAVLWEGEGIAMVWKEGIQGYKSSVIP